VNYLHVYPLYCFTVSVIIWSDDKVSLACIRWVCLSVCCVNVFTFTYSFSPKITLVFCVNIGLYIEFYFIGLLSAVPKLQKLFC